MLSERGTYPVSQISIRRADCRVLAIASEVFIMFPNKHTQSRMQDAIGSEITIVFPKKACAELNAGCYSEQCGRAWLAQLVRSLPSDDKVHGSIPGFAEIRIFVRPSFSPQQTRLSFLK